MNETRPSQRAHRREVDVAIRHLGRALVALDRADASLDKYDWRWLDVRAAAGRASDLLVAYASRKGSSSAPGGAA